jgi:hypothetical protein
MFINTNAEQVNNFTAINIQSIPSYLCKNLLKHKKVIPYSVLPLNKNLTYNGDRSKNFDIPLFSITI